MKKIIFTALTLMVLAGSTFTVSTVHASSTDESAATKKTTIKPASIPPPNCQIDDPNGCGIFG
jgi:hypothetical protein